MPCNRKEGRQAGKAGGRKEGRKEKIPFVDGFRKQFATLLLRQLQKFHLKCINQLKMASNDGCTSLPSE